MPALRTVIEAALAAHRDGDAATLAVVVATEGSTYVGPGAMAVFGASTGQVGWLSGGCLEPEIERRAREVAAGGNPGWMRIDTRDDVALFSGSAVGCRGQLHIALLPLAGLSGWPGLAQAWLAGEGGLHLSFVDVGTVEAQTAALRQRWEFGRVDTFDDACALRDVTLHLPPPPTVLVLGAGPETSLLLSLLKSLGWVTTLAERRPRWRPQADAADHVLALSPGDALAVQDGDGKVGGGKDGGRIWDAALVMHHHFELDREALVALAASAIPFIGLLGPVRRREDLFKLLPDTTRQALLPRLHSPVGLNLGGQGPEAIALSIAAQLQSLHIGAAA
jgi:xanthine dehydrogenase accessory factor